MKKILLSLTAAAALSLGFAATAKADPGFGFGFGFDNAGHSQIGFSVTEGYGGGYYPERHGFRDDFHHAGYGYDQDRGYDHGYGYGGWHHRPRCHIKLVDGDYGLERVRVCRR